jgi:exonuclease VII large subunit
MQNLDLELRSIQDALEYRLMRQRNSIEEKENTFNRFFDRCLQEGRFMVERFESVPRTLLMLATERLTAVIHAEKLLKNGNPKKILSRGYSIVRTAEGALLKQASSVDSGETLMVELAEGKLMTKVI